jgi:hypothetical protein
MCASICVCVWKEERHVDELYEDSLFMLSMCHIPADPVYTLAFLVTCL